MSVKVRCTGCDKVLTAPDAARGKSIKCPSCDTKVKVPAADKPKKSASKKPVDSEDAIAALDLRQAEDENVRICGKCGYDMSHRDEDETECPKCGYDSSIGGLGEKAQKRRLKGPDPDKFYAGLWKSNWKFVFKNQGLAWRTMLYTLIASMLMFLCAFMYLYIPMWPPRMFFAMCATVSGLMIPGWLWFMDQEVMVGTLQKKDKLKRVNFDFFLCSALGIRWVAWHIVFALPVMLVPLLFGWILTSFVGLPPFVFWIFAGLGYLPVLAMITISTGHFVMPVQAPGWMFWKVAPAWFRTLKPTLIWLFLTLMLHAPAIGCLATIGALYGPQINQVVAQMEENADTARFKAAKENAGKKEQAKFADDPRGDKEYHKISYSLFVVPSILWATACLLLGFPAAYSCRVNGQFIYYFRDSLDLVALAKEYKYVSKARPEDEEDEKPKTMAQVTVDAVAVFAISMIIGLVIGFVSGALGEEGMVVGLLAGFFIGLRVAFFNGSSMITQAAWEEGIGWGLWVGVWPVSVVVLIVCGFVVAFVPALMIVGLIAIGLSLIGAIGAIVYTSTHWMEARTGCLVCLMSLFVSLITVILIVVGVVAASAALGFDPNQQQEEAAQQEVAPDAAPAEAMPMPEAAAP
ncbi:hypothetical protein GC163_07345 [bacterium]|nr:hypothetical protein [bacterium]